MTNGTLTKMILKAGKVLSGDNLKNEAKRLMNRFPLSSHKLLYDSDKSKVSETAWDVLVLAAIESDREKLNEVNSLRREAGLKPDTEFGRYKAA